MRKSIFIALLPVFIFAVSLSAQEAEVTAPPQSGVDISGLRDQMIQIEEARKMAIDFESPAYFPSDWEAVESSYAIGNLLVRIINITGITADETELSKLSERDVEEGKEWLGKIQEIYNELFRKSIPLYAQAREDEIMAIRDELIGTGLVGYFPEYLRSADIKALKALDQYESEEYYTARETAVTAMDEYQALLLGANTYLTREELISTGLTEVYPELLESADDNALAALDIYETDDYIAAQEAGASVLAEYETLVIGANIVHRIEALINTGLPRQYPDFLSYADSLAFDAVDQFEAEEYDASKNIAAEAYDAYNDLYTAAVIYLRRQEILNRGFYVYDVENFDNADEIALDAIDLYEAGNRAAAMEKAEEVQLRYNVLLTNGWISYAADQQTFASVERERAIADRVHIAMREAFRAADFVFNQAGESFITERYEEAAALFTDAEALFVVAIGETAERRRRAEEAIRMAEEEIEESMGAAIEAERIIEGGSR